MPAPEQARLAEAFHHAMTRPEVLQRMAEIDTIPLYLPPAAFKADVAAYLAFWSGLVDRIGLSVEG